MHWLVNIARVNRIQQTTPRLSTRCVGKLVYVVQQLLDSGNRHLVSVVGMSARVYHHCSTVYWTRRYTHVLLLMYTVSCICRLQAESRKGRV